MAALPLDLPALSDAASALANLITATTATTTTTPTAIAIISNTIISSSSSSISIVKDIHGNTNNMTFGDSANDGNHLFMVPPQNVSDTNHTGNRTSLWIPPLYIMVWITITNVLVFLVGVIGNLLVIMAVLFVREMKTSTNLCLMNLAVADLLVLVICQPSSLLEYFAEEKWLLGEFMCKLVGFMEQTVTVVSILTILCVSLERFWAVCYPLKTYSSGSKSRAMIVMLGVWVVGGLAACPMLLITQIVRLFHTLDNEMVDVCETYIYKGWHKSYIIGRFVIIFAIPLVLLTFLYSMIIVKVINRPMECKQMTETARAQAQKNRRQLVVMLIGIIVLFFLCLLPFRVFTFWILFSPEHQFRSLSQESTMNITHFVRLLIYINSAGNPIIYHLFSTKFRRAFQRVLRMYCPCMAKLGLGSGVHANGTYSHATRMTTMTSHYSVVKQTPANDYSDSVDAV